MPEHMKIWTAPGPFWEGFAIDLSAAAQALGGPEILRFANDNFMDELAALLSRDPHALRNLAVRHETWRGPEIHDTGIKPALLQERKPRLSLSLNRKRAVKARRAGGKAAPVNRGEQNGTYKLKLYQPAHQRYYLVSACLVCAVFGFPDQVVDAGSQERVNFVVRRLLPVTKDPQFKDTLPAYDPNSANAWAEYAFVQGESGFEWRKLPDGQNTPMEGEERLPLFPMTYCTGEDRKRRLFAGLIPVGRREAYMGARAITANNGDDEEAIDPRMALLQSQVLAPWEALVNRVGAIADGNPGLTADNPAEWVLASDDDGILDPIQPNHAALTDARAQLQTASWYILLDLADFLKTYLDDVWQAIAGNAPAPSDTYKRELFYQLDAISMSDDLTASLKLEGVGKDNVEKFAVNKKLTNALKLIADCRNGLESETSLFDFRHLPEADLWPDFLFVLADPWYGAVLPKISVPWDDNDTPVQNIQSVIEALGDYFRKALDPIGEEKVPQPTAASLKGLDMRDGWFVIRCVYERPECGPLQDTIVSAPTRAFQLAAFFDPDAPARPIRIGLPIDTTPAGLRKFDKNAVFMISDILCGQISRMKGITFGDLVRQVLPWPLHKGLKLPKKGPCKQDGFSLGMMCSLSIPIITLCALMLLMIMVNLLDFIFRWLPFFIVCFPLPGFKGKKE